MTPAHDWSANEMKKIASDLVRYLRNGIKNTRHQDEWTQRNLGLLRKFARKHRAVSFPTARGTLDGRRRSAFLWDFVAYKKRRGILLAVESEHLNGKREIEADFDKLLYVRSPVKLMLCRIRNEGEAEQIRKWLERFMKRTCSEFSPAEVFVLYCVWWAADRGKNRDIAYVLQIRGKPSYLAIRNERFEATESAKQTN